MWRRLFGYDTSGDRIDLGGTLEGGTLILKGTAIDSIPQSFEGRYPGPGPFTKAEWEDLLADGEISLPLI